MAKLSKQQLNEMKQMISKGIGPEDISNHFNVAISNVHYYKAKFKKDGLEVPNLKGRRPTGSVQQPAIPAITETNVQVTGQDMRVVVNGVPVTIHGSAKNVTISNGSLQVDF
jgi:hypothetical protein